MMVRKNSALSSLILLLAFSLSACAGTTKTPDNAAATPPADATAFATLNSDHAVDGAIVRVTLHPRPGEEAGKIKVTFEGTDYPVIAGRNDTEWEAFVAVPFNSKPRATQVTVAFPENDTTKIRADSVVLPLTVEDGHYSSETLKVDKSMTHPSRKMQWRIQREAVEIGKLYRVMTPKKYWKAAFSLPIKSELTSPFGNKRLFNGEMKSFHQGLDLRAKIGTAVRAPEAGKVVMAKELFFTGNTVILDHGYGLFTVYAHLSHLDVKPGDEVMKNHVLGLSGMTGRAAGPHLHWGAVIQRQKVNPLDLTRVLD